MPGHPLPRLVDERTRSVGWCDEHDEPVCPSCRDDYGHVTCHHPDHEDYCPEGY